MRSLFQFSACASFLFLIVMGGYQASPESFAACGLDLVNAPYWYSALSASQRKSEELNAKLDTIFARTQAKNDIVRDLIAGRLTVVQATVRFRDLPGLTHDFWVMTTAFERGVSHEERLCRYTIGWVEYYFKQECETLSVEAKETMARLNQELRDHLIQNDGIVNLP